MDVGFQPFLFTFDRFVDLFTGLPDQEQPAEQQDQIAKRDLLTENGKERIGQLNDPGDRGQQRQTHDHRAHQTDPSRVSALGGGQLGHDQREK
jgi:hypothetical protein